jgi:hypothetical protein
MSKLIADVPPSHISATPNAFAQRIFAVAREHVAMRLRHSAYHKNDSRNPWMDVLSTDFAVFKRLTGQLRA